MSNEIKAASLLGLPRELRNQIFSYFRPLIDEPIYVTVSNPTEYAIDTDAILQQPAFRTTRPSYLAAVLSLRHINGQIRDEIDQSLLASPTAIAVNDPRHRKGDGEPEVQLDSAFPAMHLSKTQAFFICTFLWMDMINPTAHCVGFGVTLYVGPTKNNGYRALWYWKPTRCLDRFDAKDMEVLAEYEKDVPRRVMSILNEKGIWPKSLEKVFKLMICELRKDPGIRQGNMLGFKQFDELTELRRMAQLYTLVEGTVERNEMEKA